MPAIGIIEFTGWPSPAQPLSADKKKSDVNGHNWSFKKLRLRLRMRVRWILRGRFCCSKGLGFWDCFEYVEGLGLRIVGEIEIEIEIEIEMKVESEIESEDEIGIEIEIEREMDMDREILF